MSSRREVLIRILALLQRKTLLETKNRTLKCLKRHCSTVQSMKNVAVLMEDGAFALFFRPHPGGFDSSRVLIPGNLPSKGQNKCQCPGVSPGGGRLDAAGIDWCIMISFISLRVLHRILLINPLILSFLQFFTRPLNRWITFFFSFIHSPVCAFVHSFVSSFPSPFPSFELHSISPYL